MKKTGVLVLITVFLMSCEKQSRTIDLNPGTRSVLKEGDTLTYISNLNNKALYVVRKKIEGYFFTDRQPFPWSQTVEGPDMAKNYYQAEATLIDSVGKTLTAGQVSILNSDVKWGIIGMYSKVFQFPGFVAVKNYALNSTFWATGELSVSWYDFKQMTFKTKPLYTILNTQFKNVFYCDLEPPEGSTGRYVSTVYCNSINCLLGFRYSDGEIFELQ